MAQPTRQGLLPPRPRPLSTDFSNGTNIIPTRAQTSRQPSMLYSLLPSAVQSRLHHLPSVRRSVSTYGLKWRARPGTEAPLEGYNTIVLSGLREVRNYSKEDNERGQGGKTVDLTETKSGIGWKFAGQGLSLLSLSVSESTSLSQTTPFDSSSTNTSGSFARQLYIHALSYLLRGLPTDLTPDESIDIRSALPASIKSPLHIQIGNSNADPPLLQSETPSPPSLLHRFLASAIIMFFIAVQFVLPYTKTILKAAWQYERTHRIAERMLKGSIDAVDAAGRFGVKGVGIGGAVWQAGLGEVIAWVVEGVSGGVKEGVDEGLGRVGVKRGKNGSGNGKEVELWKN